MAALPPPEINEGDETYAWNAIARGYADFMGDNPSLWPERKRQFIAGLRQQLATDNQGEAFFRAAQIVIELLEVKEVVAA